MRPLDAIAAGYNEITHFNFVIMQAMPQDVVDQSNGLQRFLGPARYAGEVDLTQPPITTLVDTMAAKGVASDTTIAGFEEMWVCEPGKLAAGSAPWAGRLPPVEAREAIRNSCDPMPGSTLAQERASFNKFIELIGIMHRRGIPIVAGTDDMELDLDRDIELFHQSGFTRAEAIAAATIVPARLSGRGDQTGSIAVGKRADLILVEGNPEQNLGDLRNVTWVMRDGRLMSAKALRELVGLGEPLPH
jgi:Amidohydrolase family